MAKHLSTPQSMNGLMTCLLLLLALGWCPVARSETRTDPTVPPPAWLAARPNNSTAKTAADLMKRDAPSGVQLILTGRTKKIAVIDGRLVEPGADYNGSKVLDIKAGEVVMQDSSKSLKLTPAVEKIVPAPVLPMKSSGAAIKNNVSANENRGSQ